MRRVVILTCAAAVLTTATAAWAAELGIGDAAPKLEVTKWVKGQPVDLAAAKGSQIVVLEFWATWCSPCIESIPHLTELQQEYADKNVVIVGVSPHDSNNTLEMVQKFVEKNGEKMGYAIAFDQEGKSEEAFMKAAGEEGLPSAFVIDKAGRVAWIGDPRDGLDTALADMVAGKYDIKVAGQKRDIHQRGMAAYHAGEWDKLLALADEYIALDPHSLDPWLAKLEVYTLHLDQPDQGRAIAKKAVEVFNDDATGLAALASAMAEEGDPSGYNSLALKAANRAVELAPKDAQVRTSQYGVLNVMGRDEKAFAAAGQAVDLMKDDARALGEFAGRLSSPDPKNRCNDLAIKAVELAIAAEPDEPAHLAS
ncbi:MAG: redoxin domain-containing protein, partial [Planctomycetota bacterium]